MPRNGSGTAVGAASTFNPAVAGTTIDPGAGGWQTAYADILAMLTQSLSKDGQTILAGSLDYGGSFKNINMANGTAATDSATLGQVQAAGGSFVTAGGVTGTADAILLAPSPAISAYAAGQEFWFVAEGTNTVAVTVAVSGLAAKAIQANAVALVAGDIVNTRLVGIKYDGTQFQLIASRGVVSHTADIAAAAVTLAKFDTTGAVGRVLTGAGSGSAPTWTDPGNAYSTGTFTPGMTFGGSATGVTFSGRGGSYWKIGSLVFYQINISLSNNGSGVGTAVITGLPFSAAVGGYPLTVLPTASLASMTGAAIASADPTTTLTLYQTTATGVSALTDTNITNTASFTISGFVTV